ncbi:MAG: GAK system CofD-like protein [Desulfohalobiaceae bacterium]|nr:GAK system CofD-like protein [Desulfohalobiaceae bacterium]
MLVLPEEAKLADLRAAPHLGPRVLFFSGGSALKDLSRTIIRYTHNSIHVVTTFDSGGSSAGLRKAFCMPAVGDIRNRLMALSDQNKTGNSELYSLFTYRLPAGAPKNELLKELKQMAAGSQSLVRALPEPIRRVVCSHLEFFMKQKPASFNPQGASIGNLLLTAGYLEHDRRLDPVIDLYSELAMVRGVVRPVLDDSLQLTATLDNGTLLQGQHLLTGKQTEPIASRVKDIYLSRDCPGPVVTEIREDLKSFIARADLICYPMGSFYSSLIANLLLQGVTASIAGADCPKVFIPNTFFDPECYGLSLSGQVRTLLRFLSRGVGGLKKGGLDYILLDTDKSRYQGTLDPQLLEDYQVKVLEQELVTPESSPSVDPRRLLSVLLSLAKG